MLVVMDESGFVCLPTSQDHKRVGEGDLGPNTGDGCLCASTYSHDSVKIKSLIG